MRAEVLLVLWIMPVAASAAQPHEQQPPKEELSSVLRATPDLAHGRGLFSICSECHGRLGEGNASGWPPQIAGQHRAVIAKELVDYRAGVRWYDPMERIAGRHVLHAVQDIADVAAYAASLPPSADTTLGPVRSAARAAGIYRARCEWCHGAQGEGSEERLVPRVAGQQYEYLLRQLQDTIGARRPNMQAQHLRLLEGRSVEELQDLAAYMSRLGRTPGS